MHPILIQPLIQPPKYLTSFSNLGHHDNHKNVLTSSPLLSSSDQKRSLPLQSMILIPHHCVTVVPFCFNLLPYFPLFSSFHRRMSQLGIFFSHFTTTLSTVSISAVVFSVETLPGHLHQKTHSQSEGCLPPSLTTTGSPKQNKRTCQSTCT